VVLRSATALALDSALPPVSREISLLSGASSLLGANTEFRPDIVVPPMMHSMAAQKRGRRRADLRALSYLSREAIGFTDLTPEDIAAFRPGGSARAHPSSDHGRKSLFLCSQLRRDRRLYAHRTSSSSRI